MRLPETTIMPKPARLSVCLIVKNEAKNLAHCLASVAAVASECHVIDTGSEDQTVAIAQQAGAQVHHFSWQNDFAQARNFALQQATGDWVLMLDGDEFLAPDSVSVLQDFLRQAPPAPALISVRLQHLDDAGEIQRVDFSTRLYTRHPEIVYRHAFHERLQLPENTFFESLPAIQIQHLGYAQAQMQHKAKTERDLTYLAQMRQQHPEQRVWLCYTADVYFAAAAYPQALPHYLACLSDARPDQQPPDSEAKRYLPHALQRALRCYLALQESQAGLELARRFPYLASQLPGYWYVLGQLQRRQQRYTEAIQSFGKCLEFKAQEDQIDSYDPAEISHLPLIQIAQIYRGLMLQPHLPALQQAQAAAELLQVLEVLWVLFPTGTWSPDASSLYIWSAEAAWVLSAHAPLEAASSDWPRQTEVFQQIQQWRAQVNQVKSDALEAVILDLASQSKDSPLRIQSLLRIGLLHLKSLDCALLLLRQLNDGGQAALAQQQKQEMALILPTLLLQAPY